MDKFYTVECYEPWEHHAPMGYYKNKEHAEKALKAFIASDDLDDQAYYSYGIEEHEFEVDDNG